MKTATVRSLLISSIFILILTGLPVLELAAQTYTFSMLAGSAGNTGSADGTNSTARFNYPTGVAVDSAGNVYVADTENNTIRKITPGGAVSTLAGLAPNSGSDDGTGSTARFHYPTGVAVDSAGNVYVADTFNSTIRKITPVGTNWVVSTLAGGSRGSADGTNSAAQFAYPRGVAVDSAGNVYVADSYYEEFYFNDAIRKITPVGVVTTLAGLAGSGGSDDGTGSAARFNYPTGVAVDSAGNVDVADTFNSTIRKITPVGTNWVVSTLAGLAGVSGTNDGTGTAAQFYNPWSVAVDSVGNVYVADTFNHTIRKGFVTVTAMFTATPTNGVAPLIVTFSDTSTGTITNRSWDFGDGSTSNTTATTVVKTYASPGTNTVSLTVSGPDGSNIQTQTNYIVVNPIVYFFDDFSTYIQNTALVPQQGWVHFNGNDNLPFVTNNAVYVAAVPGFTGVNGEEPYKNFPVTSNGSVFVGMVITVTSAPPVSVASPSRMLCLFQNQNSGGFARDILSVRDTGTNQFVFCARNNGIFANAYKFGTTPLNYETSYRVVLQGEAGNTNTFVYVNPGSATLDTNTAYVAMHTATTTDPNVGSVQIANQFTPGQYVIAGVVFPKICVSTNYAAVYNFLAASWPGCWNTNVISAISTDVGGPYYVGDTCSNNYLEINSGGSLTNTDGYIGNASTANNNTVLVTGTGSLWKNNGFLYVGDNGASNQLAVASNGFVIANNVVVGVNPTATGNRITLSGGSLMATNGLGTGALDVRDGTFTFNGGTVTVNQLVLTNGVNSVISFNGGTLNCGGTFVTNSQTFAVGNGSSMATYHLNGGIHSFNNGLRIRSSGMLTGCGTINGNVVVDSGGTVLANCGTTLNFSGIVTNNGNFTATGGTVLRFYGPVVNNGFIDATGGDVQFFSTINDNGTILTPTNSWTDSTGKWETSSNWSHATPPSRTDAANLITNAGNNTVTIDATTASNFPSTLTINNLTVSAPGAATNTLFLDNAGTVTPLQVLGVLLLGTNGAMVVNNSAMQVTNSISIGNSGAGGSLVVSNGGSLIVTNSSGSGSVVVNGGLLILGMGTFKTDNLVVTNGGAVQHIQTYQVDNATVTVAGGNEQAGSNLVAGSSVNSTGIVTVTDGGQLVVTNGVVGIGNSGTVTSGGGVGRMTVSNGTLLASTILLGSSAGGQGELTLADGGLISGSGSNGILVVNGFDQVGGDLSWTNIGSAMYCGYAHPGAYALSNGNSSCQDLYVGYDNAGTMTIAGGAMSILSCLTVGHLGAPCVSTGAVWITGGQLSVPNNYTIIGNSGAGRLTISNGTMTAVTLIVGNGSNPGTLTVAGGTMTLLSGLTVGDCGGSMTGIVMITGGNLFVTNAAHNAMLDLRSGRLTLNGGQLKVDRLVMTNACALFIRGGGILNVTSLGLDPNLDADGDGMPNGWEQRHGLDPLNAADANADNDEDGLSNLQEFQLGTDPTDSSSPYRITAIAREGNNVRITWTTVGGTTNVVQVSSGGADGSYANNFSNLSQQLIIDGSTVISTNYIDSGGATNSPSRYYRIRVLRWAE